MSTPAEPPSEATGSASRDAKRALRDQVLTARRRPPAGRVGDGRRGHRRPRAGVGAVRRARTVAAYVSVGRGARHGLLLERLARGGQAGAAARRAARPRPRLGGVHRTGVAGARAPRAARAERAAARAWTRSRTPTWCSCPGLAVSADGDRLGPRRGLLRPGAGPGAGGRPVAVLLHEDEVGVDVPAEPHDRPVTHAITPAGVHALGTADGSVRPQSSPASGTRVSESSPASSTASREKAQGR